jgi:hypothetical protein
MNILICGFGNIGKHIFNEFSKFKKNIFIYDKYNKKDIPPEHVFLDKQIFDYGFICVPTDNDKYNKCNTKEVKDSIIGASKICDTVIVKSAYSIFKNNASDTVSAYLGTHEDPVTITIGISDATITKNSSWSGSSADAITYIRINGEAITDYTATLAISSIKDSNGSEIAIDNMRKKEGTYKVTYQVTFEYTVSEDKKKKYTQPVIQNVTVVNESA